MATKTFIYDNGVKIPADSPEAHKILLADLQNARDYSYEANMGDYSLASIDRAREDVEAAKKNLTDAGYEIPEW